tara:strand:+ start:455 stop:652 length:198 start_codon:yes stop_codon:yes gene_type:complete
MSNEKNEDILSKWDELKVLMESLELDVNKNAHGNKSAGVRVRKGLRLLKTMSSEFIKASISSDKE